MDIFDKCQRFYSASELAIELGYPASPRMMQALGLYPYFMPIDHSEGNTVMIDGKELIMLGSNNYLGLTSHPDVKSAAEKAVRDHGTGCTGSRFMNGTLQIHIDLEKRLASLVGKEKALVFSTGFQTNLGVLASIVGKGDVIICDKEVHASIVDAVLLAKAQAGAEIRFYRHNNMQGLEHILSQYSGDQGKLVVVDGVFSMEGDLAPLPDIVKLCKQYGARLMVDDAHGVGVLGNGSGSPAHWGCTEDVDIVVGTFSKSLASMGGFVAAREDVIHWIQHRARSLMFSASLSPANVAAVLAAIDVIDKEPERIDRVLSISGHMRNELRNLGYNVGESETPIVPIIIGDQFLTMQVWDTLLKAGVYTNVALPPAVVSQKALLRTSYMSTHTDSQLDQILSAFDKARAKLNKRRRTGKRAEV